MTTSLIKADYKSLIHDIRGYKVMFDFDLSALYGVETKRLKESVRRNIDRFPDDFMIELNGKYGTCIVYTDFIEDSAMSQLISLKLAHFDVLNKKDGI